MASSASITIKATDQASPVVKSVQGSFQRLAADAKGSILTGVGLGAGVTAFALLQRGVTAAADALGGMVQSAIDDEASLGRLHAALQANVPGWDGNTDAIERTIAAGERLAFTDDEQRASLALLVGATHDTAKAQDIMATAMDLARFKGISLQSASEALVKVEAGQFRILKSLGIELRAGATQTEALAAVQAVAGGQAAAFGETTAGAMESAKIAIEEAGESLGYALLPAVKEIAEAIRDDLAPMLREAIAGLKELAPVLGPLATLFRSTFVPGADAVAHFTDEAERMATESREATNTTANNWIAMGVAIQQEATAAATEGAHMIGQLPEMASREILDNEHFLTTAIDDLLTVMETALTPAGEIAQAIGVLTDQRLIDGLHSSKPAVVAKAQEIRDAALAQLANTTGYAGAGSAIGLAWIGGITGAIHNGVYNMTLEVNRVRNLMGHSLPTAGPLKGDAAERGGTAIGESWAAALARGIGTFSAPSLGTLGLTGGTANGGGSMMPTPMATSPITIQVYGDTYGDGIDRLAEKLALRMRLQGA